MFLSLLSPSGLVGLSLSYALSITGLLSGLIFSFTQTEMQLVSVERTEEYSSVLPIEPQQQQAQVGQPQTHFAAVFLSRLSCHYFKINLPSYAIMSTSSMSGADVAVKNLIAGLQSAQKLLYVTA